ncbi:MAG TPA: hypothetical protein VIH61_03320, partial [Waddliaceae bacterium]
HVLQKLDTMPQDSAVDYYIYNISQDDLDGRRTKWDAYPGEIQEELALIIAQVKLLNGEINLTNVPQGYSKIRQEARELKHWIRRQMKQKALNPTILEANLKKYLRTMRPSDLDSYHSSTMAGVFKQVSKEIKEEMDPIKRNFESFEKEFTEDWAEFTREVFEPSNI